MNAEQPSGHASRAHFATWFILPALVAGISLVTWHLQGTALPKPAASGLPLLASIAAVLAVERIFPMHRAWNRRPDGKDLLLLVVNRGVDVALLGGMVTFMAHFGSSMQWSTWWPTHWPVPLQVLLGITVAELIRYALHRASHRPGFLWRVHRTHHEPNRMYVLNGPRLHPANYLWVAAAHGVPPLLFGASFEVVVLVINLTALFVVFQHANVDLRFDGLNQVLATPDVHRLHHARTSSEGINYAIVLLVLDRIFGTHRPPQAVAEDGIGLTEDGDPGSDAQRLVR